MFSFSDDASSKDLVPEEELKNKVIKIINGIESTNPNIINKLWLCHLNELESQHGPIYKQVLDDLCNRDNLFHQACLLGDDDLVSYLLLFTTDINIESKWGSPLYLACKYGLVFVVDVLLNNKARICDPLEVVLIPPDKKVVNEGTTNKSSEEGEDGSGHYVCAVDHKCCFYEACVEGWVDILKMLIDAKAEYFENVETCKRMLRLACYGGHTPIVYYCIERFLSNATNRNLINDYLASEELITICLKCRKVNLIQTFLDHGCQLTKRLIRDYPEPIFAHLALKFTIINLAGEEESCNNKNFGGGIKNNENNCINNSIRCNNNLTVYDDEGDNNINDDKNNDYVNNDNDANKNNNINQSITNNDNLNNYANTSDSTFLNIDTKIENYILVGWQNASLRAISKLWLAPYLSQIVEMDLSDNDLGILPSDIPWKMVNLRSFIAMHSSLFGISGASSKKAILCQKLEFVNISHNHNMINLPEEMFCLTSLKHLNASHNCLQTLSLSEEPWSCVNLKELILSSNKLMDLPFKLHQCTSIQKLCLNDNDLSNFIPPWNCPMKYLDLSKNQLTDLNLGFDNRWTMTLVDLNLSHNQLTHIPLSICSLEALEVLNVSNNDIIIMPPHDSWSCKNLKIFNLSFNNIGADPNAMTLTPILNQLLLKLNIRSDYLVSNNNSSSSSNNLYMQLPLLFTECLQELDLRNNSLTCIPEAVMCMKELKRLDLSDNLDLKDLPDNLSNLFNLEMLLLEGISFSDSQLANLTKMGTTKMIQAYLRKRNKECVKINRLQVVVLGSEMHGKTSLCKSLESVSSSLSTSSPSSHRLSSSSFYCQRNDDDDDDDNKGQLQVTEIGFTHSRTLLRLISNKQKSPQKVDQLSVQLLDVPSQVSSIFNYSPFFTPTCLFIITFDLRICHEACTTIRTWLSYVQAYNAKAHVIIVGTFLDQISQSKEYFDDTKRELLKAFCQKTIYPIVEDIIFVSNVGDKDYILNLKDAILNYYDKSNYGSMDTIRDNKKQQQQQLMDSFGVPKDYLQLQKLLVREKERMKEEGLCPILNEMKSLIEGVPNHTFITKDDIDLAVDFLRNSGYLLNFVSDNGSLCDWYFIDFQWLSTVLLQCLDTQHIKEKTNWNMELVVKESELEQIFKLDVIFKDHFIHFKHGKQLLEAFDIIHNLYKDNYLLTYHLPTCQPMMHGSEPTILANNVLTRIYKMIFVPHTLMRNVIVQLLSWKLSFEDEESNSLIRNTMKFSQMQFEEVIYWDRGIVLKTCSSCYLSIKQDVIPTTVGDYERSTSDGNDDIWNEVLIIRAYYDDDEVDDFDAETAAGSEPKDNANILYTLHSLFSLAIDIVHNLIEQRYTEMIEKDYYMDIVIPCPQCCHFEMYHLLTNLASKDNYFIKIFTCVKAIICSQSLNDLYITCSNNGDHEISLKRLVPDLLLLDLPSKFHLKHEHLPNFNDDNILGRGGEGVVYKGQYMGVTVAIKKYELMTRCLKDYNLVKSGSLASRNWSALARMRCDINLINEIDDIIKKRYSNVSVNEDDKEDGNYFCSKGEPLTSKSVAKRRNSSKTSNTRQDFSISNNSTKCIRKSKRNALIGISGNFGALKSMVKRKDNCDVCTGNSDSGVEVDGVNSRKHRIDDSLNDHLNPMYALYVFENFRQETTTLARFKHPCIISLIGVCVLSFSFLMDLSPIGSLRSLLGEKWSEIKFIVKYKMLTEIISALKYLHKQNLVYKDMKPENILVWSITKEDDVCVKLSDYGLTRRLFAGGLMGVEGTCGYQAPEMWLKKPYNEKVDIFAFAMVAYELLQNDRSFFDTPSSIIINKYIQQGKRPNINPTLSYQLRKIITKSWSQEPNDRPSACELETMMQDMSLLMLKRVVNMFDSRIIGEVNAVCFNHFTSHIHLWTGKDSGRCCHTYNVNAYEFVYVNFCCPGSKVVRVCVVRKDLMVLTTEEQEIQLLKINPFNGSVEKIHCMHLSTVSTVLISNHQVQNNCEFYLGLESGEIIMYEVEEFELKMQLVEILNLSDNSSDFGVSSACFVYNHLWASCALNIYVVKKLSKSELTIAHKINLCNMANNDCKYSISSICSINDQVWCLLDKIGLIVEIDAESFEIICFFDCSLSSVEEVIVNYNMIDLSMKLSNFNRSQSFDSLEEDLARSKHNCFEQNPNNASLSELEKSARNRRKRSLRLYRLKKAKLRSKRVRNESIVMSIECCNGVLWLGTVTGEMVLVNVIQDNSEVEYGQVLNVMRNEENFLDVSNESFCLSHMVKINHTSANDNEGNVECSNASIHLVTVMSYKKKKLAHKRVKLLLWNCSDTTTLHSYSKIHKRLNKLIELR